MSGIPAAGVGHINALLRGPALQPVVPTPVGRAPVAMDANDNSVVRALWTTYFPQQRDAVARLPGVNFTKAHQLGIDTACAGNA